MSVMCLVCVLFHGSLYPLFSILRNVFSLLYGIQGIKTLVF